MFQVFFFFFGVDLLGFYYLCPTCLIYHSDLLCLLYYTKYNCIAWTVTDLCGWFEKCQWKDFKTTKTKQQNETKKKKHNKIIKKKHGNDCGRRSVGSVITTGWHIFILKQEQMVTLKAFLWAKMFSRSSQLAQARLSETMRRVWVRRQAATCVNGKPRAVLTWLGFFFCKWMGLPFLNIVCWPFTKWTLGINLFHLISRVPQLQVKCPCNTGWFCHNHLCFRGFLWINLLLKWPSPFSEIHLHNLNLPTLSQVKNCEVMAIFKNPSIYKKMSSAALFRGKLIHV